MGLNLLVLRILILDLHTFLTQGFFFYRFVQEGGDRPHVRATDTSVNLSDGNWHHFVGIMMR